MLSDISLVPKGIDEEKVYLNNIEYTNIIRRYLWKLIIKINMIIGF